MGQGTMAANVRTIVALIAAVFSAYWLATSFDMPRLSLAESVLAVALIASVAYPLKYRFAKDAPEWAAVLGFYFVMLLAFLVVNLDGA